MENQMADRKIFDGKLSISTRFFISQNFSNEIICSNKFFYNFSDRSASFSARPKGDIQFQRPPHASSSTSQLQSHPDSSQTDFHHQSIASSIGGSSGVLSGSPQANQGADGGSGDQTPSDGKRGKQKTAQPNARSESYKECSPKRSRTNRPKSDPSLYE